MIRNLFRSIARNIERSILLNAEAESAGGTPPVIPPPQGTETFYITDNLGNILTDNLGNRLTYRDAS